MLGLLFEKFDKFEDLYMGSWDPLASEKKGEGELKKL